MNLIVTDLASRETASFKSVAAHEIEFVVGDCALGKVLVARSPIGVCAILFGSTAEEVEQDQELPSPLDDLERLFRVLRGGNGRVFLPLTLG